MTNAPALSIRGLRKRFARAPRPVLSGVNLAVGDGETVAVIGRSGAGKSTLARCIAGLEIADEGSISIDGAPHTPADRHARRRAQLVWQDPVASLSPYRTVMQSVAEPLNAFNIGVAGERGDRIRALLEEVGLESSYLQRRPHEMSGGECQRVALARALACEPRVLLLDEPLSALDPPRQLLLSEVLAQLTRKAGRAVLLISHDLTAVRRLSSRVALLDEGTIVEDLPTAAFFDGGTHAVTRRFLEAWPPLPFSDR